MYVQHFFHMWRFSEKPPPIIVLFMNLPVTCQSTTCNFKEYSAFFAVDTEAIMVKRHKLTNISTNLTEQKHEA